MPSCDIAGLTDRANANRLMQRYEREVAALATQALCEMATATDAETAPALDNNDRTIVVGAAASGAGVSGAPVLVGTRARADESLVDDDDANAAIADLTGKIIVKPYCLPGDEVRGKTADITNQTPTTVIAAPGAGIRLYITQLTIMNSHATVGTWVDVLDDATEIQSVYAASAGGGVSMTLPVPLRLGANIGLAVVCATTGANVRVSASGYTSLA